MQFLNWSRSPQESSWLSLNCKNKITCQLDCQLALVWILWLVCTLLPFFKSWWAGNQASSPIYLQLNPATSKVSLIPRYGELKTISLGFPISNYFPFPVIFASSGSSCIINQLIVSWNKICNQRKTKLKRQEPNPLIGWMNNLFTLIGGTIRKNGLHNLKYMYLNTVRMLWLVKLRFSRTRVV